MSVNLSRIPRLHLAGRLSAGAVAHLSREQAHYLRNVLRLTAGDRVRLFNGDDGEWLCSLTQAGKKQAIAVCDALLAEARALPDIDYLFAPLKHARLDYMVQKATEMGVRRLRPILTERTAVSRINLDRMRANTIEAAEQCNLVGVPDVLEPVRLNDILADWERERERERTLIYCDEQMPAASPVAALQGLQPGPLAVLVGPEGGFSDSERAGITALDQAVPVSLGPRIMRADTAAVAVLALVQATCGDWGQPEL